MVGLVGCFSHDPQRLAGVLVAVHLVEVCREKKV